MNSLSIRKGDMVKVLSGKDRGKTGKVLEVFPKDNRLAVEGINIRTRFSKPKKMGEKGQRLELPAAINISKLMLLCPHCGRGTRVGHETTASGRFRKCKKCGKIIA